MSSRLDIGCARGATSGFAMRPFHWNFGVLLFYVLPGKFTNRIAFRSGGINARM